MIKHRAWSQAGAICRGPGRLAACVATTAIMLTLLCGCGQARLIVSTTQIVVPASTAASATTSTSADGPEQTAPVTVDEVFARLAAAVRPMTVFAPAALPEGATLCARWLPVIESADPEDYSGPDETNPQVLGSGADSEIQAVFQVGRGWLVVIENFHGDLGDVTGEPVGDVAGHPAALFAVNGGELVQWSADGRWYGVFGRGVELDAILAAALGMKAVLAEGSR
jgi:hypothetical protein